MRVAVTGGNGFLAGYLKRELKTVDMDSVLLVRQQCDHQKMDNYTVTDYSVGSLSEILRGGKCYCAFSWSSSGCPGFIPL